MLQQPVGWFSRQNLVAKLAIGCAGLLVVCCVCSVPISILNPPPDSSTDAGRAERPAAPAADAPAESTEDAPAAPEPTAPPEPTAMPTASGATRDDPVPMETGATIQGDMIVTVLEVGRLMDAVVSNGNMFNREPGAGEEYIQVVLQIECQRSSSETCALFPSELKIVGQDGIVHEAEFVSGIEDVLDTGEFFGGSIRVGRLFFIVPQQAAGLLLFHDPTIFGSQVYFALP
jgi:hypothetical protein